MIYKLLPGVVNRVCVYYISTILFKFHWDFDSRHYFYDKRTFKSSPSATLYLEMLVTIARVNLKQCALTVSYVIFPFFFSLAFCVLFSYRQKWLSYLSHAINPYLHGKLINWRRHFIWAFVFRFYSEYWIYKSLWIGLFKKILLDRRHDEPLSIYSRFVEWPLSELFSCNLSLWYQCKYIAFNIFS